MPRLRLKCRWFAALLVLGAPLSAGLAAGLPGLRAAVTPAPEAVAPATAPQKARLQKLSPDNIKESRLAGEPITAKLTRAPGNDAPIGGLKVVAESGWFAARPSGTEDIYKIYAESFQSEAHLNSIVSEAQEIVDRALDSAA